MSDTPRYQSGDQCFDSPLHAAQAHLAKQSGFTMNFDFGGGPVPAFVVPFEAADWGDSFGLVYEVRDVESTYEPVTLNVSYYPVECTADIASRERLGDVLAMWPFFLAILAVLWLVRRLTNLFTSDTRDA